MVILALKCLLVLFAVCVIASIGVLIIAAMKIQSELDDEHDHPLGKY